MPLDAFRPSSDARIAAAPRSADMGRLLFRNSVDPFGDRNAIPPEVGIVIPNAAPNPSSAAGHADWLNLFTASAHEVWEPTGMFVFTDDDTVQWEWAKNFEIQFSDTTGGPFTTDIRHPLGGTRYAKNPYVAAAWLQRRLNDASGDNDYTVTYDGARQGGTFKFTITKATGTFSVLAAVGTSPNSCFPSMGFAAVDTGAAASHTGTKRAIHTEEWIILPIQGQTSLASFLTVHGSSEIDYSLVSWLALVNFNYEFEATHYSGASGSAAGTPKVIVKFSRFADELVDQADSAYTEGTDMFHLHTASNMGTYMGMDLPGYPHYRRRDYSAGYSTSAPDHAGFDLPSRYWCVDLGSYNAGVVDQGGFIGTAANAFMMLKVVNPENQSGKINLGYMYAGPGWAPFWNFHYPVGVGPAVGSSVQIGTGGAFQTTINPHRQIASIAWTETWLTESDYWLLRTLGLEPREMGNPSVDLTMPWRQTNTRGATPDRPMIFIDPLYGRNTPMFDDAAGDHSKYARGLVFGRGSFGSISEFGNDFWNVSGVEIVGEDF